jgi:predicted amidohydrolase
MKALLAQLACRIGDIEGNTERAIDAIRTHQDVDIAVFPELYLSGYTYRDLDQLARAPDGEELSSIAAAAAEAETAVVIGFAERTPKGVANSAACIDADGSLAGVYRKTYLFPSEADAGFLQGEELMVLELAGLRAAPLICFDIEFPEPSRQVALAGAELLVTASANMDPFFIDHAVGAVARAHENRLPHLYANLVGSGDGLVFVGASRSVAPTGDILVEASRDEEELLVVPVAEPGGVDPRTDYPRLVRPPLPVSVFEKERVAR